MAGTERVLALVENAVPPSCVGAVRDEFKKDFVFAKKRSHRTKKRKSEKTSYLTRREKELLGFHDTCCWSVRHDQAQRLHRTWCGYMAAVLELGRRPLPGPTDKVWDSFTQAVYKADFHGSLLKVIRSKCPSYVDKEGICVMDTRQTFKIVSHDNIITTIPKKECVFEMSIYDLKIVLFGKHLCIRPAERSVKKIKCQQIPNL